MDSGPRFIVKKSFSSFVLMVFSWYFVVKRLVTYLFAVFCTCRVLVEKHRQELTVQREFPAGVRARETEIAVGYNAVNAGTLMQITFLPIQV